MATAPIALSLEPMLQAAESARTAAREQARAEVGSRAYTGLKLGLGELIARLADRSPEEQSTPPLSEFAGARLKTAAKRMQRARAALATVPADAESAAERVAATHALRLQVKKLRYACEALAPVYVGRRARRYQRRLQGLQALLGDFNDAATAQTLAATLEPGSAACACVQGFAASRMLDLMARLPGALQRFERARAFW
jgi:CHAD domain-containing protein